MNQLPTRRSQAKPRRSSGETLRGLVALAALLAIVAGAPTALLFFAARLPLDLSVLTADALLRPDDGRLLLLAIFTVAWAAWAVFTGSIALEVWAVLRHTPTPRLPGLRLPQQSAAALVAAAAVLITPNVPVAHARPVQHASITATADDHPETLAAPAETAAAPDASAPEAVTPQRPHGSNNLGPSVVVQRHDTLWSLAEKHLGAGERFVEVLELNRGITQPDGRRLENPSWLYPGWVLRLPADATTTGNPDGSVARSDGASQTHHVEVEPGDTLWEIAEDELGNGARYPEIFHLNKGDPQPDGGRLADPDLIQPGWTLHLTNTAANPSPPSETPPGAQPQRQPHPAAGSTRPAPPPVPAEQRPAELAPSPTPTNQTGSEPSLDAEDPTHNDVGPLAVLSLGLGGIALAGLVTELARRRRHQQRVRRPGQRIRMPKPETASVEAVARADATPASADALRRALRQLGASCASTERVLPDVVIVRIGEQTIELVLDGESDNEAVPPFVATSSTTWLLDRAQLAPTVHPVDPYPTLLTVGSHGADLLLLNLESVGTLHVIGDANHVASVLRAMAVDLVVGPTAGVAPVTLVGNHADLARVADSGQLRTVETTTRAEREITAHLAATANRLRSAGVPGVRELRSKATAEDLSATNVVLATEQIGQSPRPWSGVAVIAPTLSPTPNGWQLVVDSDAQATLQPPGLTLRPAAMDPTTYQRVVDALRVADQQPVPEDNGVGTQTATVIAALPEPPDAASEPATNPAPRLLLLGTVEIHGVESGAVRYRQARATELVAYLALHPDATGYQIEEALWPGKRVEPATRRQLISRARTWLGTHPDGEPYLQSTAASSPDRFRLRPEISCDWYDFLQYAKAGLNKGQQGIPDLEAALDLVRGRPFLGIDPRRYTWAEPDIQEMISTIADVAHELSTSLVEKGDHAGAMRAAIRGLAVEPCSEQLFRDAITAAEAAGNLQEALRLADRLETVTEETDADGVLDDETAELVARIRDHPVPLRSQ